jgi:biopolymer transport protein ExbD
MAKKRSEGGCELDMTPMIDVVFQLMIFFVVTIKMDESFKKEIELADSKNGPIIEAKGQQLTTIIEVDRNGVISMRNRRMTQAELRAHLTRKFNRHGEFQVLIRGDYRTKHKDVRKVMDICTECNLWKLDFAAIKERKINK